jgi:hypothetical protein
MELVPEEYIDKTLFFAMGENTKRSVVGRIDVTATYELMHGNNDSKGLVVKPCCPNQTLFKSYILSLKDLMVSEDNISFVKFEYLHYIDQNRDWE